MNEQSDLPIDRPRQYHGLKCIAQFFDAIKDGSKTFEVRWDDRGYQVGDVLILNRIIPEMANIMDPQQPAIVLKVTYVLRGEEWGIMKGYVVLGFEKIQAL
jgi:hypothetical protein